MSYPRKRALKDAITAAPLLLTIPEAAAALRCSAETVRLQVRAGRIPHLRLGSTGDRCSIRIPVDQLKQWIAEQVDLQTPKPMRMDWLNNPGSRNGTALVPQREGFPFPESAKSADRFPA